jgi:hypothetical protein
MGKPGTSKAPKVLYETDSKARAGMKTTCTDYWRCFEKCVPWAGFQKSQIRKGATDRIDPENHAFLRPFSRVSGPSEAA